eukprot:COSAG01_NODE_5754_length_4054_cov_28.824526_1_plen_55_part_10
MPHARVPLPRDAVECGAEKDQKGGGKGGRRLTLVAVTVEVEVGILGAGAGFWGCW